MITCSMNCSPWANGGRNNCGSSPLDVTFRPLSSGVRAACGFDFILASSVPLFARKRTFCEALNSAASSSWGLCVGGGFSVAEGLELGLQPLTAAKPNVKKISDACRVVPAVAHFTASICILGIRFINRLNNCRRDISNAFFVNWPLSEPLGCAKTQFGAAWQFIRFCRRALFVSPNDLLLLERGRRLQLS